MRSAGVAVAPGSRALVLAPRAAGPAGTRSPIELTGALAIRGRVAARAAAERLLMSLRSTLFAGGTGVPSGRLALVAGEPVSTPVGMRFVSLTADGRRGGGFEGASGEAANTPEAKRVSTAAMQARQPCRAAESIGISFGTLAEVSRRTLSQTVGRGAEAQPAAGFFVAFFAAFLDAGFPATPFFTAAFAAIGAAAAAAAAGADAFTVAIDP